MSEVDELPEDHPINEYFDDLDLSDSTVTNRISLLKKFEGWLSARGVESLLEADHHDVRDWLEELHHCGFKGSTVKQYHAGLKSFYSEFVGGEGSDDPFVTDGELERNPAQFPFEKRVNVNSTKASKQQFADNNEGIIHLKPSEIQALRQHVKKPKVRNELVIKVLVQTGLRRAELANLEYEDHLNREKGQVTVPPEVAKTKNGRTVPFKNLDLELSLWLDGGYRDRFEAAEDSPYLFLTRQSEKLSPTQISTIVRDAADRAGIQETWEKSADGRDKNRITPHSLRSTFIMRLFDAGLPAPKIMELAGHQQLETTKQYANAAEQAAINAYNEADIDFGTE